MKFILFLSMLMGIACTSRAEPAKTNLEDLRVYEKEQWLPAKQFNLEDETPVFNNENTQITPALSFNDVFQNNVKEWSEQSFVRAINRLGILKIPGLKLVKLPKSMINTMKRMPNHAIVRPLRYVSPDSKVAYDVAPIQCKEVLQEMFTLAHADSSLAYKVQTMKCVGSCPSGQVCVLKKKTMIVYLIGPNKQLFPKSVDVGCSCGCM